MTEGTLALVLLAVSVALSILGWAFRAWAQAVKDSVKTMSEKLEAMSQWLHEHVTVTERRVTRVETKVDMLILDAENRKKEKDTKD